MPMAAMAMPACPSDMPVNSCSQVGMSAIAANSTAPSIRAVSRTTRAAGRAMMRRKACSLPGAPAADERAGVPMRRCMRSTMRPAGRNTIAISAKAARQLTQSASRPPATCPTIMPVMVPVDSRASVAWRWSRGTTSPTHAMDMGMMAAQNTPVSRRASSRLSRLGASAQAIEPSVAAIVAVPITRSLPSRSPRGPQASCIRP